MLSVVRTVTITYGSWILKTVLTSNTIDKHETEKLMRQDLCLSHTSRTSKDFTQASHRREVKVHEVRQNCIEMNG